VAIIGDQIIGFGDVMARLLNEVVISRGPPSEVELKTTA